jgi:trehalose 6-phosphate synthase/phosphatase
MGRVEALVSEPGARTEPAPLDVAAITRSYRLADRRLLLLDYDGTLVSFTSRPEEAVPTAELIGLLARLSADSRNSTVLISGRKRADLDGWFGGVPGLCLAAEHGATVRQPGSSAWKPLQPAASRDWMKQVRPILELFVNRTPGSFIEEKEYALVWHYRMAAPEFGERLAYELAGRLEGMMAETEVRAILGRKIVEVKPLWIQKGAVAERFSAGAGPGAFQFAIGDDRTDEDMFAALPESAWTVHVGTEPSRARFFVPGPGQAIDLLTRFAR